MNKTFFTVGFCLLALLPGCGDTKEPTGNLHGRVTFQGVALTEGIVIVSNAEKGVSITAPIGTDGKYEAKMAGTGLPVGSYKVSVRPPIPEIVTGKAPPPPKKYDNIPMRYRDEKTSDLKVEITAAGTEFNIELKP